MDIGRKKYSCKYPNCENWYYTQIKSQEYKNKHFFCFPKKSDLETAWKKNLNIGKSINCANWRICEEHFEDKYFINSKKEKLNCVAVPRPLSNIDSKVSDKPTSFNAASIDHSYSSPVNFIATEHNYYFTTPITDNSSFSNDDERELNEPNKEIGLSKHQLTPAKKKMYRIHRSTMAKLSSLKNNLRHRKNHQVVDNLHRNKILKSIEQNLNEVINSQLRNANKLKDRKR